MATFTSAEAITRSLRAKTASAGATADIARRLLAGEYPIYLPNSSHFVFELICDRVSDFSGKNFSSWKYNASIWALWLDVWTDTGRSATDRDFRGRTFSRAKFVSVFTSVLEHCAQDISSSSCPEHCWPLLDNSFRCLDTFSASGFIELDEYSAIGLLKSYLALLNAICKVAQQQLNRQSFPEGIHIDVWTKLINKLFQLPHRSSTYKPTKKSTSKYFSEVLPLHLSLLTHYKQSLPPKTFDSLHRILIAALFEGERSSLLSHLTSLMQSPPDLLDETSLSFLFQLVISNFASTDIATCEAIYNILASGKFAFMAENLIGVLSKVNRTLSSSFYSEVYDKELGSASVNWLLVSCLLLLSPDLAISKWKDVIDGSSKKNATDLAKIAENIVSGFVVAREIPLFVSEAYPHALIVSDTWSSQEVTAVLAPKMNEMSAKQICKLAENFLQKKAQRPLALLLQGLLYAPQTKQTASQHLFTQYSFCYPGWSDIAYYVLCIYGNSVVATQPEIAKRIIDQNIQILSRSDVDMILRISELTGSTETFLAELLDNFMLQMDPKEILPFFQRWIVILGLFPNAYDIWLQRLFHHISTSDILFFFKHHQILICERPLFLESLSKYLKKNQVKCTQELLGIFPSIVFKKFFSGFLDKLCRQAIDSPQDTVVRSTLKHVLQDASLSSVIEKDFLFLKDFISSANQETLNDTLNIAKIIWKTHYANYKDPASAEYISNTISTLLDGMKMPSSADLHMCTIIMSSTPAKNFCDVQSLADKYVAFVCTNLSAQDIEADFQGLAEMPLFSKNCKNVIKRAIKNIDTHELSVSAQCILFNLTTKISDTSDALFIVSLYVALLDKNDYNGYEAVLHSIMTYVNSVPEEIYFDIFSNCILSLHNAPTTFVSPLVDLGVHLSMNLKKGHEDEHARLFVAFIQAVAAHQSELRPKTSLHFLKMLTTLLSEKIWVFRQFVIELVLTVAHSFVTNLSAGPETEPLYLAATQMVSFVVLFHRFRLSSRYHLALGVISDMLMPLSIGAVLEESTSCASAYSRLLSALCEIPISGNTGSSESLTSRAALSKRALRKHAHVLLVNYIHTRLTQRFQIGVDDNLLPGLYSVFGLLSKDELRLTNKCLDPSGRAFFRNFYATYKEHGKWREQT